MTDLIPPENDRDAALGRVAAAASGDTAATWGDTAAASGDAAASPTGDDRSAVVRIAAAHTAASRDVEALLRRLPAIPGPADLTEYATLLAREETLRAERRTAAAAAGLDTPSVGGG